MKKKAKQLKSKKSSHPRGPKRTVDASLGAKESREIVLAIRKGKIDALVMPGAEGDQVLTLQGSDHPYRLLVETVNDGVATLSSDGTILYANSRLSTILRVPFEGFIGSNLQAHVPVVDRERFQQLIVDGSTNSIQGEITLEASEGRPRLVRLAITPVRNSDVPTLCIVATEMTELVEANEALKLNEDSLQLLSARLLKLQDEERRRIARDLHDITGQKLAVQAMSLSKVANSKTNGLDADSRRVLTECTMINKEIGEEIRTLSYLLHPPLLDELGLSSAVKWYAEGFEQRTGIKVKVDVSSDFLRLPPDVEVALFRVVQESLTNVHRYSGSPKADVRLAITPDVIEVQIRDYGRGMAGDTMNSAAGRVAPLGVGIQGMKERIRQLDGRLEIVSGANRGTLITATLPVAQAHGAAARDSGSESENVSAFLSTAEVAAPIQHSEGSHLRKQILIADDHEMLRRGLRSMLEKEGDWEICGEAVNGQDAVEKAATLHPDLVILDINMPVLNGLAAVRQILRQRPQPKVLIFTVHDSEQTAKEVQASGAHGYLSKNNASDNLLRVVRDLLQDHKVAFAIASSSTTPPPR